MQQSTQKNIDSVVVLWRPPVESARYFDALLAFCFPKMPGAFFFWASRFCREVFDPVKEVFPGSGTPGGSSDVGPHLPSEFFRTSCCEAPGGRLSNLGVERRLAWQLTTLWQILAEDHRIGRKDDGKRLICLVWWRFPAAWPFEAKMTSFTVFELCWQEKSQVQISKSRRDY